MEKVNFKEFVSVENICKNYDMNSVDVDWFKGEGVYEFKISCRGELDDIVKVSDDNSFMLKSKEEIVKLMREEWKKGGELEGWEEEYWDEFCYGERVDDYEGRECYIEGYGEEDCSEFYWVKK